MSAAYSGKGKGGKGRYPLRTKVSVDTDDSPDWRQRQPVATTAPATTTSTVTAPAAVVTKPASTTSAPAQIRHRISLEADLLQPTSVAGTKSAPVAPPTKGGRKGDGRRAPVGVPLKLEESKSTGRNNNVPLKKPTPSHVNRRSHSNVSDAAATHGSPPTGPSDIPVVETTRIANSSLSLPWTQPSLSSTAQAVVERLLSATSNAVANTAWVPMVDLSGSSMNHVLPNSFFGGNKVLMRPDTEWPVCLSCRDQMLIVCQVDRSSLLHPFQGKGLVQLFVCIRCTHGPIPNARTARSVCWATCVTDPSDQLTTKEYVNHHLQQIPRMRRVVKWLPRKDFMHPYEAERLCRLAEPDWEVLGQVQVRGDKIGGFAPLLRPDLIEEAKLRCKVCAEPLRLLLTVDSGDNAAFEWGHDGCVLVYECAHHPDQLSALVMTV